MCTNHPDSHQGKGHRCRCRCRCRCCYHHLLSFFACCRYLQLTIPSGSSIKMVQYVASMSSLSRRCRKMSATLAAVMLMVLVVSVQPFTIREGQPLLSTRSLLLPSPRSSTFVSPLITTTGSNQRGSCASSNRNSRAGSSTQLNMFMGSDGGVLGIGGPELVSIYTCMYL
jgi:hypothetical protein